MLAPPGAAAAQDYLAGFVNSEWDTWGEAIRAGGAIPK